MAAPRVTIDTLPEKISLAGTEWFIVQDGATSKKVSATNAGTAGGPGGGGLTNGDKGDIVVGALGESLLFDSNVVSGAARTLLDDTSTGAMRTTLGLGNVDNTADTAKPLFTVSTRGLVPPPGSVVGAYLSDGGTWVVPTPPASGITTEDAVDAVASAIAAGAPHPNMSIVYNDAANSITFSATAAGGVSDGDKGDVIVSGGGVTWLLDPNVVTSVAKTVLDDTTIPAMRTTLGLGNVDNTSDANKPLFTTAVRGLTPAPLTTTGAFLKDDGTWAVPPSTTGTGIDGTFALTYNVSVNEGTIAANQIRGDVSPITGSTKLWVSETTLDGVNITLGLSRVKAGHQIYVQDWVDASKYALFNVTSNALDKGLYWEMAVTLVSSAGTIAGGKVAFQPITAAEAGSLFSVTTTGAGLTPGSNGVGSTYFLNGAGSWAIPAGGGGGGISTDQAIDAVQAAMSATAPIVVTQDSPLQTIKYSLSGTMAQFNTAITDGDIQPLDADLTAIAGLTPANSDTLQFVSGAWANRTPTQAKATLAITQADVAGLGSLASKSTVANADMAAMPATTVKMNNTAGNAAPTDVPVATVKTALNLTKTDVGLGNVDNTADTAKPLFSTTTTTRGVVPGSNGVGVGGFLRGDGQWALPSTSLIVQQPGPPSDTSVLWADTDEVGIEENVRYIQNQTNTTYTLVLADRGKLILSSNAATQVITVPTNATAAFLIGTQLDIVQYGAGITQLIGATGVTLNGSTSTMPLRARYSATSLIKVATDAWLLIGDLA